MFEPTLRAVDTDLWVAEQPQKFLGLQLGTRMTVVRLGEELVVLSAISPTPSLVEQVEALGTVRWVVAPNCFHHLYAGAFTAQFDQASLLGPPGIVKKRSDLAFDGQLPVDAPAEWEGQLEFVRVEGMPKLDEALFFHPSTRTLITCDLAFCFDESAPFLTRCVFRVVGGYGKLGPSVLEKVLTRDRGLARASLRRALEWDFERVIVAHGRIVESGGRADLESGYSWLLADG